jgi:hypothetical protein
MKGIVVDPVIISRRFLGDPKKHTPAPFPEKKFPFSPYHPVNFPVSHPTEITPFSGRGT